MAFPLFLPILTISSLLMIPTAFSDYYINAMCSLDSPNKPTPPFKANVDSLLANLHNNTPSHGGFWNASSGQVPDQVYGLSLCRVGVSNADCWYCISLAREIITAVCKYKQAAITWFDHCYLKYSSNLNSVGHIDTEFSYVTESEGIARQSGKYNVKALELLSSLSRNAAEATNKLFASGEVSEPVENVMIYGVALCSRDLSKNDCKSCLDGAVGQFRESFDNGKVGAGYFSGSCIIRYANSTILDS
ncbi:cysteine-rich repeat secretory protein 38 [Phtheirospermum japonicum]|uniref:Cysteine-rich repeat secretory protein 38 n=1 Tax=Phtheirospermum japonicum TaxID=374723 RepID=A0A830D2R8_9LAMI|nr:cysteine-rich repeat secretory protein 38 [Phtheirospermum japonicum]